MTRFFIILISFFIASACSDNKEVQEIATGRGRTVFHESDLNSSEVTASHNDMIILGLESSAAHKNDIGKPGTDVIEYEFDHSLSQRVCLEKHDSVSYGLKIYDENENMINEITSGNCEIIDIDPGRYSFHYFTGENSADSVEAVHPLFIRPLAETSHCADYNFSENNMKTTVHASSTDESHCSDNSNLSCHIPEHYSDLSYQCKGQIAWNVSNMGNCWYMDDSQSEICSSHLYSNCEELESICVGYWKEWTDIDGTPYIDWNGYGLNDIWKNCFRGSIYQYANPDYRKKAGSIMKDNLEKYISQFCSDVKKDCSSGWKSDSPVPDNCKGFVSWTKYGELNLESGEIAVYPRTYLHVGRNNENISENDIVMKINGRCDSVSHRSGSYILGPHTQAVIYSHENLKGTPMLLENRKDTQSVAFTFPSLYRPQLSSYDRAVQELENSMASSLTVIPATFGTEDKCRIKDVGLYCGEDGDWSTRPQQTGEVTIIRKPDPLISTDTSCSQSYLLSYRCDDLEKLGIDNSGDGSGNVDKVVLPDSNTVLRIFTGENYSGEVFKTAGKGEGLTEVSMEGEIMRSAHAYRLQDYNHTILVSLRKCCGCNLENVNFSGDDLSNTVLTGSDLDNASFSDVDLTGADLRAVSMENARFNNVSLGGNYMGCAEMNDVDMSDPDDSSKSRTTISEAPDWQISSSYNEIEIRCDNKATSLNNARIPVQFLPGDTWSNIDLRNAVLLDKKDGYDLSGLDMKDSDYTGLRAGGKMMNMQGADLSGTVLTGADFSSVDFSPLINDDTSPVFTDFTGSVINGVSFANANLEGAIFDSVVTGDNIRGKLNFSYSFMINTTIKDADIGNADFTYAYFYSKKRDYNGTDKNAVMENVTARQANFSNSFMSNMTFANVEMKDCSFSGAQLVGTEFISGNMRGSVFSGAYLQGADLSDVEKTDASFAGAYLSPDGGYWHYTSDDPECSEIRINYKKTDLGDSSSVVCPNGEKGPCDTEEKLTPKNTSGKEPPCVDGDEDIFGNNDCIKHEYLKRGEIPECSEENEDVMQCGCLVSSD